MLGNTVLHRQGGIITNGKLDRCLRGKGYTSTPCIDDLGDWAWLEVHDTVTLLVTLATLLTSSNTSNTFSNTSSNTATPCFMPNKPLAAVHYIYLWRRTLSVFSCSI